MYICMVLQRTKVLSKDSTDSDDEPQFHGVRNSFTASYCIITWLLFGAAIVFLDKFLIKGTDSCDPSASKANCFLNTGFFNTSALYDEPIDCSNEGNLPGNVKFICYRYTLDLGGAFGTAMGNGYNFYEIDCSFLCKPRPLNMLQHYNDCTHVFRYNS